MRRVVVVLLAAVVIGLGLSACQPFEGVVALDAGPRQTCMVRADGSLWCVGYGPKLDGRPGEETSDGPVRALEVSDVAAPVLGLDHSCAVLRDGTMRCWGTNATFGQLGDGTTISSPTPVVVNVADVVAADIGSTHTCALLGDGRVRCWGDNGFSGQGMIGDGTTAGARANPQLVVGLDDVVDIGVGASGSCAVDDQGLAWCWGTASTGQVGLPFASPPAYAPVQVPGIAGAVRIDNEEGLTCAVLAGGEVRCWGSGLSGRLATGTETSSDVPVTIGGVADAVDIAVAARHVCALIADGTVRCWGYDGSGQLGDGPPVGALSAAVTVTGIEDAVALDAGLDTTCVLREAGTAACWGRGVNGALGDHQDTQSSVDRPAPVVVQDRWVLGNVGDLAVGPGHTCLRFVTGVAGCTGNSTSGRLGNSVLSGPNLLTPGTVTGLSAAIELTAGGAHTCALLDSGGARCWGLGSSGQRGTGTLTNSAAPQAVVGAAGLVDLDAGENHTCGVAGSGVVSCWGDNAFGQVGDGSGVDRSSPVAVPSVALALQVAAGDAHTCAVVQGGTVRCWGENGSGRLGDGTTTDRPTPVSVSGLTTAIQVVAGSAHSCALLVDSTVRCWGRNADGQLGDGTTTTRATPVAVPGMVGATQLVAGSDHTCARLVDGTVRCWGRNADGQLGDGTTTGRTSPAVVVGLTATSTLGAGGARTCATTTSGQAACWGDNTWGGIGDGTTIDRRDPALVLRDR